MVFVFYIAKIRMRFCQTEVKLNTDKYVLLLVHVTFSRNTVT